ncbi:GroES-like protein [Penicillium nucicola]|uniref:GroES-like protein n=1 Tax=Penicillium nucicola TaxID=1850975 RepID=UPI00254500F8|nr:GroES-like protein [Penicillium nucicola]KAJ5753908.1 GroES-like protein [Penicillium nucicola]
MATNSKMTSIVVRVSDLSPRLSREDIPRPCPAEHQVLVKISHVAQNPTDVQSFDSNAFGDGVVLGCDFVGEVVDLGASVTRYAKGEVIAGLIWGGETKGLGAYSQYALADERISYPIPDSISREHASTVPLAAATAWLALWSQGCLAIDRQQERGTSVLIWGGSSSVGLYAIQLAAMYGLEVVTTCSPKHADLVRSYGARYVFDYRSEDVVDSVKLVAPTLKHAFDTIGNADSSLLASAAFGGAGTLCTVRPGKANTEKVSTGTRVTDVLVWTAFLKDHAFGPFKWPASQEDHELSAELFQQLPSWLEKGTLKPSHPRVLQGLESVSDGFQEHRDGKISGYKIVYAI